MSTTSKSYIKLLKDVRFLPVGIVASSADEFQEKSEAFKRGTLFTNDFSEADKEPPAPRYGWMYKDGDDHKFAHRYNYILDNWQKQPDLFEEA